MKPQYKDEQEYQYFAHFRDEVSHELSGPFQENIWNYVVLQAANTEPAVRKLTISIAALRKAKTSVVGSDELVSIHHQYALKEYAKAISGVREIASTRQDGDAVRMTLIAAALIFCFENLYGEYDLAITHIQSALKMMHSRIKTTSHRYSLIRNTSSIMGLEGELLSAFVRMDITLMSRMEKSPISRTSLLDVTYDDELNMPTSFHNMTEARNYLEHIQYKSMEFLSHLPDVLIGGSTYSTRMSESDVSPAPDNLTSPLAHYREYKTFQGQINQWYGAFARIFARACTPAGSRDFIAAATLRVLALRSDLSAQRITAPIPAPPDLFVSESREIVLLCKSLLSDPSFKRGFVFDCGFIPTLFVVITVCRQRDIREEAIRVLRQAAPRREFTWDAEKVADIGEAMLAAEDLVSEEVRVAADVNRFRGIRFLGDQSHIIGKGMLASEDLRAAFDENRIGGFASWATCRGMTESQV